MNSVSHSSAFPVAQIADDAHSLAELREEPRSAVTIAALLATCDHPTESRVAFDARAGEEHPTAAELCGQCGAMHLEGQWIRPALARLVTSEQLSNAEQLAIGLRELAAALGAIEDRFRLGVARCDGAEIAMLHKCAEELATYAAGLHTDKLAPAFARLAAADPDFACGWG